MERLGKGASTNKPVQRNMMYESCDVRHIDKSCDTPRQMHALRATHSNVRKRGTLAPSVPGNSGRLPTTGSHVTASFHCTTSRAVVSYKGATKFGRSKNGHP